MLIHLLRIAFQFVKTIKLPIDKVFRRIIFEVVLILLNINISVSVSFIYGNCFKASEKYCKKLYFSHIFSFQNTLKIPLTIPRGYPGVKQKPRGYPVTPG